MYLLQVHLRDRPILEINVNFVNNLNFGNKLTEGVLANVTEENNRRSIVRNSLVARNSH